MNNDRDLSAALRALADGEGTGTPPTDRLLARGHRSVQHRLVARSAGVAGLVAVVAGGALATAGTAGGGGHPARQPTAGPRTQLVAAVTATGADTFRFRTKGSGQTKGLKYKDGGFDFSCRGAADPAKKTGRYSIGPGEATRIIGDDVYVEDGGSWLKETDTSVSHEVGCGHVMVTADPATLLDPIRKKGTVKHVGRHGAVDVYSAVFTDRRPDGARIHITATVSVGVHTKRVKEVESTATLTNGSVVYKEHAVTSYSGYGDPVTVQPPAHYMVEQEPTR